MEQAMIDKCDSGEALKIELMLWFFYPLCREYSNILPRIYQSEESKTIIEFKTLTLPKKVCHYCNIIISIMLD